MAEYPLATGQELGECDGACFGSPTRFGNAAAPMRNFFDSLAGLWTGGQLIGKPGGTFTGTATLHGGQEVTSFTMWPPMVHLGMIIVGIPYSVPEISSNQDGRSPTALALAHATARPSGGRDLGRGRTRSRQRVAEIASKLKVERGSHHAQEIPPRPSRPGWSSIVSLRQPRQANGSSARAASPGPGQVHGFGLDVRSPRVFADTM